MRIGRWAYVLCAVASIALLGAGNVLLKFAYASLTPLWTVVLRFGIATLLFGVLFGRQTAAAVRRAPLSAWLPSAGFMAGCFVLAGLSVSHTTATTAGFFFALPLLFTPGIALLVTGARIRLQTVVVQLVVLGGLYLLCCNGGSLSFGLGEVFGLACSACYAAAIVFGERGMQQVGAVPMAALQVAATAVMALVLALVFEPVPVFAQVGTGSWAAVLALGTLSSGLAFFLTNLALERVSATVTAVAACSEPVFTALLAYLALGETLSAVGLLGGAIIVACTVVAALPPREPAPTA